VLAGVKETRLFPRSDTPPGGRQVIARRQRYTSGMLKLSWNGSGCMCCSLYSLCNSLGRGEMWIRDELDT